MRQPPHASPPTSSHRCATGLLVLLLISTTTPTSNDALHAPRHPQDGPDVDVQLEVKRDVVSVRLTFNLAFVDAIVEPFRESMDTVDPAEEDGVREALFEYLKENNQVRVDGVPVPPIDKSFSVDPGNRDLLPLFPSYGARALFKLRLVLEYPLSSKPNSVAFFWKPYPENKTLATPDETPRVAVAAQLFAEGGETLLEFNETEPEYVWHASGKDQTPALLEIPTAPADSGASMSLPLITLFSAVLLLFVGALAFTGRMSRKPALGLIALFIIVGVLGRNAFPLDIGSGSEPDLPDDEAALAIFRPLHANIYRAFAYREKEAIYDSLAQSVSGRLLKRLYGEIYRSLVLQDEGGAVCRVKDVMPLDARVEKRGLLPGSGRPSFSVVTRWRVVGSVFHFGHRHTRTNEYEARYTVTQEEAGWRIVDNEILEQKPISAIPQDG